ncbi:MAG: YceI family protein [Flavobacterium sp.]|nr:MAG: YceI family protein [Flavobacterium sp.]
MRKFRTIAIALLVAFGTVNATAQVKKINAKASKIEWTGKKVTGQHEGTVNFSEGYMTFRGNTPTGGQFKVDMTSLTATDVQGATKDKLNGHLKSEDFFGTEKFPEAQLIIRSVTPKGGTVYTITGDLTIKNITNPVTFDIVMKGNTAIANVKVDRTKYDIKYGSGSFFDNLGDKAISDEFEAKVTLVF